MTMDAIFEERESDWSHQVSAVGTTRWLQRDQTLPLSVKGVACETRFGPGSSTSICLASFPGLPTIQLLITCSMQNGRRRPGTIYHVNDVSVYQGRQRGGGVPDRKGACVLRFESRAVRFPLCERSKPQHLGQKLQDQASSSFFRQGTLPPLCLPR